MLWAQAHYHHLIMGSYNTFEKASSALPEIADLTGQQPVILFPQASSDWYRLSVYQSGNRAEVEAFSRNLARSGTPKGWILSLSPTSHVAMRSSQTNVQHSADLRVTANASSSAASANKFHLILGSFTSYQKASEALRTYEEKGLEPYIIFPSAHLKTYRISVYLADNRSEVASYSTMLVRSGMSKGWILEEAGASDDLQQPQVANRSAARLSNPAGQESTNPVYHLIGGSFERYDEATSFMDAARAMGGIPQILWPENGEQGTFRVSVFSSTNRSETEAFQQQQQAKGMSGGWILSTP